MRFRNVRQRLCSLHHHGMRGVPMSSKTWQGCLAALALGAMTTSAQAASAPSLAGAWQLVRVDNVSADGRHVPLYGPSPQGLLLIDAQGHYALQMVRAQRTRF